jgi:ketosteroid isomerase-like protein
LALTIDDQLAIQQLYARYNHAIDSGNAEGWAACFTPDGVFNSGQGEFKGTEALKGFVQGFSQQLKARHWVNNLLVDGDGATADGTCYLQLLRLTGDGKPAQLLITAIYVDTLAKTGGDWKFTSRTVKPD